MIPPAIPIIVHGIRYMTTSSRCPVHLILLDAQSRSTFVNDQANKLIYPERVVAAHADQRSNPFEQNSPPTVVLPFSQLVSGVGAEVFDEQVLVSLQVVPEEGLGDFVDIGLEDGESLKAVLAWSGGRPAVRSLEKGSRTGPWWMFFRTMVLLVMEVRGVGVGIVG